MTNLDATDIYCALRKIGFKKNYVKALLPSWWSSEFEQTPDGVLQLAVLLSRRLNLELNPLIEGNATFKDVNSKVLFKHAVNKELSELELAAQIAKSLALTILDGCKKNALSVTKSSKALKENILSKHPSNKVTLEGLVTYCWDSGIPVIPLVNLPVGIPKMDGAAVNLKGRPAIIVARASSSKAWLAFIVAHELGHISHGHIANNNSIVDRKLKLKLEFMTHDEVDKQEIEANEFALDLLGGEEIQEKINGWGNQLSSQDIALRSFQLEKEFGFSAAHIALRYGYQYGKWADAQTAIKYIPEDRDTSNVLKSILAKNISSSELGEDSIDLINNLTGTTIRSEL